MRGILLLVLAVSLVASQSCAYSGGQTFSGWNFVDQFNFYTGADPTHGYVRYVDRNTATSRGYVRVSGEGVYVGVDYNSTDGPRNSVRLESKQKYVTGLFILDLTHMPASVCGSWPAYWFCGDNWPNNGEIDVIEGVNRQDTNQATLHTSAGCTVGNGRWQSGRSLGDNCDVAANGNAGCSVLFNKGNTFGTGFNNRGGGIYVMERSTDRIKVWYFPRNAVPSSLYTDRPDPCQFGQSDADFPLGGACPSSHFGPQKIIFNVAFCGDWAGSVFTQQGCGPNCADYVRWNPGAFRDSYWGIKSLRVYSRDH
eukprot:TRINITY_DN478_c0_g1_i1.p1 TRINITY_DN478_c0_g1~~TRINITY_DN478_c0_g1_i1.p1  ORF type:complete len:310 (-),score=95.71 TRINITY_DN478_c0_g1_i1:58-987(-)